MHACTCPCTQCRLTNALPLCADANLVVEIKHWKSKEKKFSLLAWTFLPAHVLITRANATGNGAVYSSGIALA